MSKSLIRSCAVLLLAACGSMITVPSRAIPGAFAWVGVTSTPCTLVGTEGKDFLSGTAGADVICGLGGNDTIRGRGGNDIIDGAAGDDTIYGDNGNDRIRGSNGNDKIYGGNGNDYLRGGAGEDLIHGDSGRDTLSWVDEKASTTSGLTDATTFIVVAYGNTYKYVDTLDFTFEQVDLGPGDDYFDLGPSTPWGVTVNGGAGNDILVGHSVGDKLNGQEGDDDWCAVGASDVKGVGCER